MHIHDGVLSAPMLAGGFAAASGLFAWSAYKVRDEEIPQISVLTAAFFVASLIHVPAGPTSVHLSLNGLVGILLRRRSFVAFPIALFLQAALLGHGGLSVLGVSTCIFGLPALASWWIYDGMSRRGERWRFASGALGGFMAVLLSGILLAFVLWLSNEDFKRLAQFVLAAHVPLMIIEGIITGFAVEFLARVQPDLVRGGGVQ
ncbi:MAG: cobalt transporter CbiM [Candidatus Omnitrophica bacterium]|nr:cobalt transporter CbiM [Candidatus Omnitrophota bacterium]